MNIPEEEYIEVNQILGEEAKWGIFTRTQIFTSSLIAGAAFLIGDQLWGMPGFVALATWWVSTWLLVIGENPYKFLDLFVEPPGTDWCNGYLKYVSYLDPRNGALWRKLPPIRAESQDGKKLKYMAFQDYLHLNFIFTIRNGKEEIGGYLLNAGKKYQIIWCFNSKGSHNLFDRSAAKLSAERLERGLRLIPEGEKLRIAWSKTAEVAERVSQLKELISKCESSVIRILLKNELAQSEQLTASGVRQKIEKRIFCSYTTVEDLEIVRGDIIGNVLRVAKKQIKEMINLISGNQELITKGFYKKLLFIGYEKSYRNWYSLLKQRCGMEISPMNSGQCFEDLYRKFNAANLPVPELSQEWVLDIDGGEIELTEIVAKPDDIKTVLLSGEGDSTPSHKGSTDTVYLPSLGKEIAVLTLDEKPKGWYGFSHQLKWLWELLGDPDVKDTEAIVELSMASDRLIKHDLNKIGNAAVKRGTRSLRKGKGRDAEAIVESDRVFNAQKDLVVGRKSLYAAVVLIVARSNELELSEAVRQISDRIDQGRLTRETRIAWKIWLECFPVTINNLLQQSSPLSDRRLVFSSNTVAGLIPTIVPQRLDDRGIEFISDGGQPINLDLLSRKTKRILIVGEAGSGKTGLAWRFLIESVAQNTPLVGVDFNFNSRNSFKYALDLLGDKAAHIDLSRTASNLLEPPNLNSFIELDQKARFLLWLEQTRSTINSIVTMGETDSTLINRTEALIARSLNIFFDDEDINERFGEAFLRGFGSQAWQQMPILEDWLQFVTKEHIGLDSSDKIDETAINLIHAQMSAFLVTPVGQLIGRVSTVRPDSLVKFFSFSATANKKEEYILSKVALSACLRNTLSNPSSVFIGDEIDSLLKKEGFAEAMALLCSTGRKTGMNVVLITHGIECLDTQHGLEILNSITHRMVGKITTECSTLITENWKIESSYIEPNISEKYGDFEKSYSRWLIIKNDLAWQTKCYLSPMTLAAIASETFESDLRAEISERHPPTLIGKLTALKEFSEQRAELTKKNISRKQKKCLRKSLVKNSLLN